MLTVSFSPGNDWPNCSNSEARTTTCPEELIEELADSLDDRKQNDLEEKHALVLGGQKVHLRGRTFNRDKRRAHPVRIIAHDPRGCYPGQKMRAQTVRPLIGRTELAELGFWALDLGPFGR